MNIKTLVFTLPLLMASASAHPGDDASGRCEALAHVDFSNVKDAPPRVVSAKLIGASADAPAQCRVDADIPVNPRLSIEVHLPTSSWNGKLLSMDSYTDGSVCNDYLKRGYACIPMYRRGRQKPPPSEGISVRNRVSSIDNMFQWTHTRTISAKAVVERYYAAAPERSYYVGCSGGGHAALIEAQSFPWDYDGIVAGDPNIDIAEWSMRALWSARNTQDRAGRALFTARDLEELHEEVLAQCDRDDGIDDGVLGNAPGCRVDLSRLQCRAGNRSHCLVPAQIEAAKRIYEGPVAKNGERITTAGVFPGSELLWNEMGGFFSSESLDSSFEGTVPAINAASFDFDTDYKRLGEAALEIHNNPDLRRFQRAGGKLLMYVGTNDIAQLAPGAVDYYEITERAMGGRASTQQFFRLFMVPGATHCGRGSGADTVDYLGYLEAWVEHGKPPDRMIAARVDDEYLASHAVSIPLDPSIPVAFTRPLYPYPLYARYAGNGDSRDASSFVPVDPRRTGGKR